MLTFLVILKIMGTSVKIATSLVKIIDPIKEKSKITKVSILVVAHLAIIKFAM